mgnify:FL=1
MKWKRTIDGAYYHGDPRCSFLIVKGRHQQSGQRGWIVHHRLKRLYPYHGAVWRRLTATRLLRDAKAEALEFFALATLLAQGETE